jgi:hypothetical protein
MCWIEFHAFVALPVLHRLVLETAECGRSHPFLQGLFGHEFFFIGFSQRSVVI